MIALYLDAFRSEARVEGGGGVGQVLISPFHSQQPASSQVRYHMPPRFSKEVVRGIRHAAAKAFQVRLQLCLGCLNALHHPWQQVIDMPKEQ